MSEQGALTLLVVLLFFAIFPLFWAGVVFLVSRFSGWADVAKAYPAPGARPSRWRYETAYMRFGARFRGMLNFDADAEGFTVATIWMFRPGHHPIRVPWTDVTATEEMWLFSPYVTLRFAKVPGIPMRIPVRLGHALLAARARQTERG